MHRIISLLLALAALLLVVGCTAPRHTVVLTPDPDGRIGKAEVITDGGSRLLETPSAMTTVTDRYTAPAPVATASPEFITATFGTVLAIEPLPSERFVLYFKSGGIQLEADSLALLSRIPETVKRRSAISIAISGHADAVGSDEVNNRLSLERARHVYDLLAQQGVSSDLMHVSSHGKGNPLVPSPDGVAEPRNRRVEVIVR